MWQMLSLRFVFENLNFIRWLTGSNTPTSSGGSKDTVSPWITYLISVGVKTPTETASFIILVESYTILNVYIHQKKYW